MKNKLLIVMFIMLLSGCADVPFDVEDPKKSTTAEIQDLTGTDSLLYKVVFVEGHLYAVDVKSGLVKYKAFNKSHYNTFMLVIFVIIIAMVIVMLIMTSD